MNLDELAAAIADYVQAKQLDYQRKIGLTAEDHIMFDRALTGYEHTEIEIARRRRELRDKPTYNYRCDKNWKPNQNLKPSRNTKPQTESSKAEFNTSVVSDVFGTLFK